MSEIANKSPAELQAIIDRADCLASESQVSDALDRMARQIKHDYADRIPILVGECIA